MGWPASPEWITAVHCLGAHCRARPTVGPRARKRVRPSGKRRSELALAALARCLRTRSSSDFG